MRVTLQLVICGEDGREATVTDIVTLTKACKRIEHLGLTLKEAKQLLTTIQHHLLRHQVEAFLASRSCTFSVRVIPQLALGCSHYPSSETPNPHAAGIYGPAHAVKEVSSEKTRFGTDAVIYPASE